MPSSSSRSVRIFLSSTFRDFGEERDLLVRRVFPGLRARLRERFVELVDVDLRWGITAEQAERGEVLPICLAEIDRARPYFVGMLGERYGWIPPADGYAIELLEQQGWLSEHRGGKSVTELEILHGVLNDPKMAGRAFFYFRSPEYSNAKGGDYVASSDEDAKRQTDLKDRIRNSGFPVVEDYPSPETFAERLEEDLWTVLDEIFPEDEVPDAFEREARKHDAYAMPRRRLYLGGERYASALTDYFDGKQQRILIEGQSGGGKSALLANWLEAYRNNHPDLVVHEHYLAASADAADPASLVRRLIEQIKRVTGSSDDIPGDPQKLYESLSLWLANASAWGSKEGRDWIFVIDALNNLTDLHDLRFFPEFLPEHVHFVISCLPGEVHEALLTKGDWARLSVEPLTLEESRTLLREYLKRYNKTLPPDLEAKALSHPLVTNPLFLRTLAEELRLFGVHEELSIRLDHYLTSQTVDDLFERVLERVEGDCGADAVQKTLTAIWASRSGLSEKEIMSIADLKPLEWAPIRFALDDMLLDINGRLSFAHDYMKIAISDRYLQGNNTLQNEGQSEDALSARRALHASLAQWFEDQFKANIKAKEEVNTKSKPIQEAQSDHETAVENSNYNTADSHAPNDITSGAAQQRTDIGDVDRHSKDNTNIQSDGGVTVTTAELEAIIGSKIPEYEPLVTDERAATEIPFQWQQAQDWQRLKDCLADRNIFAAIAAYRPAGETLSRWLILKNETGTSISKLYENASLNWERGAAFDEFVILLSHLAELFIFGGIFDDALKKKLEIYTVRLLKIKAFKAYERLALSLGEICRAKSKYTQANSIYLKLLKLKNLNTETLSKINRQLAQVYCAQGNFKFAERHFKKAIHLIKDNATAHETYLTDLKRDYFWNAYVLGKFNYSIRQLNELWVKYSKVKNKDVVALENIANNLAVMYYYCGELGEAKKYFDFSLEKSHELLGPDHYGSVISILNYAWLEEASGDFMSARFTYHKLRPIIIEQFGERHPTTAIIDGSLGWSFMISNDADTAEKYFASAIDITCEVLGELHVDNIDHFAGLGLMYLSQSRYSDALIVLEKACTIAEKKLTRTHPKTRIIYSYIANVYFSQSDYKKADFFDRKSVSKLKISKPIRSVDNAIILNGFAISQFMNGNHVDALILQRHACDIFIRGYGGGHQDTKIALKNLSLMQSNANDGPRRTKSQSITAIIEFALSLKYNSSSYSKLKNIEFERLFKTRRYLGSSTM